MTAGRRPRIGLVLVGAGDLTGGGGAERYFADLFLAWRGSASTRACHLTLITDAQTRVRLAEIGRDLGSEDVLVLPNRRIWDRVRQAHALYALATNGQYDILHLTLALPRHLPWLQAVARRANRARIAVNLNDYELATALETGRRPRGVDLPWRSYLAYFRSRAIDGFMVWYRRLVAPLERLREGLPTLIHAADYCFVDTAKFTPAPRKRQEILFAGRLVPVKRPSLFIDAIALANRKNAAVAGDWRFRLLGKGPLEQSLRGQLAACGLDGRVTIGYAEHTEEVFAHSSVFVSPQDEENFTSLAMLEAMACANAIIARDVGQTRQFVRPGVNGLLVKGTDPGTLADAMLTLMSDDALRARMGAESRRITLEEHCVDHVMREFDAFWRKLVGDCA